MTDLESDRVERKEGLSDGDRLRQAICAYSNDLPGHGKPGVLFIGVNDQGHPTGASITDELLLFLGGIRAEGKILPLPIMTVEKRKLLGTDVAIAIVEPAYSPPVRFDGRVWVRVGPRRAIATADEERHLTEKRLSRNLPFDEQPIRGAVIGDLSTDYFRSNYLPQTVAEDVIAENGRSVDAQMASLRFVAPDLSTPTVAGLLVLGKDPQRWIPGAYIQFVRFDGNDLAAPIRNQKRFEKRLEHALEGLAYFLSFAIESKRLSEPGSMQHQDIFDYPIQALREVIYNAVMHRNYETSNAPVNIRWFNDRIEVSNPGGLYGRVTPQNFDRVNDYRNPTVAEAMHAFRYVERFGVGISRVKALLKTNENPAPEFCFETALTTVTIRRSSRFES